MIPLHEDPHFRFRFAEDRIIPRFHLEGVEAGRRVEVHKIEPSSGERLALLATAGGGRQAAKDGASYVCDSCGFSGRRGLHPSRPVCCPKHGTLSPKITNVLER